MRRRRAGGALTALTPSLTQMRRRCSDWDSARRARRRPSQRAVGREWVLAVSVDGGGGGATVHSAAPVNAIAGVRSMLGL